MSMAAATGRAAAPNGQMVFPSILLYIPQQINIAAASFTAIYL